MDLKFEQDADMQLDRCYCGNDVSSNAETVLLKNCNVPCAGNSTVLCGGNDYILLYQRK